MGPIRSRVHEFRLPLALPVSGGHNSKGRYCRVLTFHSKDAQGPGEHAGHRIGPIRPRVHELRPPLALPVSGGHNSKGRYCRVLTFTLKMRKDQGNTLETELDQYDRGFMSFAFH